MEHVRKNYFMVLIALLLFFCGTHKCYSETHVSGHIAGSTWTASNSPYILDDDVYVDAGVTLTVTPGTVILGQSSNRLLVLGQFNATGAVFTSCMDAEYGNASGVPQVDDWSGIGFWENGTGTIENCTIRYARWGICCSAYRIEEYIDHQYYYYDSTVSPTISGNEISHCQYGITVTADAYGGPVTATASPTIINNNISEWDYAGISVSSESDGLSTAVPIIDGNSFSDSSNAANKALSFSGNGWWSYTSNTFAADNHLCIGVRDRYSGYLNEDRTWALVAGVPYLLSDDYFHVSSGATLTIPAGVRVLGGDITGDGLCPRLVVWGELNATGAIFTSYKDAEYGIVSGVPQPDDWYGIAFGENGTGTVENCTIRYARRGINCSAERTQVYEDGSYHYYDSTVSPTISGNEISHCQYGITVTADAYGGPVTATASPTIINNNISEWDYAGISVSSESDGLSTAVPIIDGNSFSDSSNAANKALSFSGNGWWSYTSNTFAADNHLCIGVRDRYSGYLNEDRTWALVAGVPYLLSDDYFHVSSGATLTIPAGVRVLGGDITGDGLCPRLVVWGELNATGAIFTSYKDAEYGIVSGVPQPDDWYGIAFGENGTGTVENCTIRYARRGINCSAERTQVYEDGSYHYYDSTVSPTISGNEISHCQYGITVTADAYGGPVTATASPTIINNNISEWDYAGISVSSESDGLSTAVPIIDGNSFSDSSNAANKALSFSGNGWWSYTSNTFAADNHLCIGVRDRYSGYLNEDRTWALVAGVPYLLSDDYFHVSSGATLTIPAGVRVLGGDITGDGLCPRLVVWGELNATGAIFTSYNDAEYGIVSGVPQPDDWYGIAFGENGTGTVENCTIRYARRGINCSAERTQVYEDGSYHYYDSTVSPIISGNDISYCQYGILVTADGGGVLATASPTIRSNIIDNCDTGIYLSQANDGLSTVSPTITSNILRNGDYGIYVYSDCTPVVGFNNIYGNSLYGVYNRGDSVIGCQNNWWGDKSGPTSPENPDGTGDVVSEKVDFFSWLSKPIYCDYLALNINNAEGHALPASGGTLSSTVYNETWKPTGYNTQTLYGGNELSERHLYYNLPFGIYNFEIRQTPDTGLGIEEYWGDQFINYKQNNISYNFKRHTQIISGIHTSPELPAMVLHDKNIAVEIEVANLDNLSVNTRVKLIIDRDKQSPWDFEQFSAASTISSSGKTAIFSFDFVPDTTATYYLYAVVYGEYNGQSIATDQLPWSADKMPIPLAPIKLITTVTSNIQSAIAEIVEEKVDDLKSLYDPGISPEDKQRIRNEIFDVRLFPKSILPAEMTEKIDDLSGFIKNFTTGNWECILTTSSNGVTIDFNGSSQEIEQVSIFPFSEIRMVPDSPYIKVTYTVEDMIGSFFIKPLLNTTNIGVEILTNWETEDIATVSFSGQLSVGKSLFTNMIPVPIFGFDAVIEHSEFTAEITLDDPFSFNNASGSISCEVNCDASAHAGVGGGVKIGGGVFMSAPFSLLDPATYAECVSDSISLKKDVSYFEFFEDALVDFQNLETCAESEIHDRVMLGASAGLSGALGVGIGTSVTSTEAKADGGFGISLGIQSSLSAVGDEFLSQSEKIAKLMSETVNLYQGMDKFLSLRDVLMTDRIDFISSYWSARVQAEILKDNLSDDFQKNTYLSGMFELNLEGEIELFAGAGIKGDLSTSFETNLDTLLDFYTMNISGLIDSGYGGFSLDESISLGLSGSASSLEIGLSGSVSKSIFKVTVQRKEINRSSLATKAEDNPSQNINVTILDDFGNDSNSNGLFETLSVDTQIDLETGGNYLIGGMLYKDAKCIGYASVESFLESGSNTVTLNFSGVYLRSMMENGPYTVGLVISQTETNPLFIDNSIYTTDLYNVSDFEISLVEITDVTFECIDQDNNGYFDILKAILTIDSGVSLNTVIQGSSDALGLTLKNVVSKEINPGVNQVEVVFDGKRIRQSGLNSPYGFIFRVYDEKRIPYATGNGTADNLMYSDFEIPEISLTNQFLDEAVDLDSDGLFDVLKIGIGVTVSEEGTYSIKARLEGEGLNLHLSNEQFLTASDQYIWFTIDGEKLRSIGKVQPYLLKDLNVSDVVGTNFGVRLQPYTTAEYNSIDFIPKKIGLNDHYQIHKIDTDANGFYDTIALGVGVTINETGIYEVVGNLKYGDIYISAKSSARLDPGQQVMTLRFNVDENQGLQFDETYCFEQVGVLNHNVFLDFRNHLAGISGDLNADGAIDLKDLILCLKILTHQDLPYMEYKKADINGDSRIGMDEALYILNFVSMVPFE